MLNAIKSPVMSVLLLHQVDSPMVANCLLETWLIATSNMIWLPNEKSELHFKIFKHYLNKTSATKLSINFMFNLVTSWQHMATFQKFQSTTTRTYQDRPAAGFAPHTRWGPRAVPRGFLRRRL
jgi:hypothetical protein